MSIQLKAAVLAIVLGLGIMIGLGTGWKLWKPKPPAVETYAPEVIQKDGSTILERKPMTLPEAAKVVHVPMLPTGAVVERLEHLTITPNPSPLPSPGEIARPCPQTIVDLSLVRNPDGTRRVIVSSPDGTVSGVDIPIEPEKPASNPLRNAAGGSYYPGDRTYGIWAERDFGPIRLGAEVFQQRPAQGSPTLAGVVRVGIRF